MANNVLIVEREILDAHYPDAGGGAPIPIPASIKEFSCVPLSGANLPSVQAVRVLPSILDDPDHPETIVLSSLDVFVLLPDPVATLGPSIVLGSLTNFAATDLADRLAVLWDDVALIVEHAIRNPSADYSWTYKNYDTITP